MDKGLPIHVPVNYYPDDDPSKPPDVYKRQGRGRGGSGPEHGRNAVPDHYQGADAGGQRQGVVALNEIVGRVEMCIRDRSMGAPAEQRRLLRVIVRIVVDGHMDGQALGHVPLD